MTGHTLKTPGEAGLDFDPEESGATFMDNALIKARALHALVGEPVVADDSGICVDALGGRPGVLSARYGSMDGKKISSTERNMLLLKELGDSRERSARFVCAMVLYMGGDRFYAVQETMEGRLYDREQGSAGFGYDPILYIPRLGRTVAQLDEDEKNALSHRGKAGRGIRIFLDSLR